MKRVWIAVLLGMLAACGSPAEAPLQGYAEGEFVRIAVPYAGTLIRLEAQRGAPVARGAPLFALEAESEAASRKEAEHRLVQAQARLDNLRKGRRAPEIDAIRAQIAQAKSSATFSASEFQRQQQLRAQGFVSQQRVDEARAAVDRDKARIEELQAQLVTAQLASRPDEIRAAESEAAAAKAALDQADWRLRQKAAVATVSGVVADTYFVRGEWVGAGQPVVSLLPPENVKARFFVPEAQLGKVRLSQPVELRCDGCGEPIRATVTWIAPQAEYTPPVIYSKESRSKLVFLVEARPDPGDAARLKPGQPLDVTLR